MQKHGSFWIKESAAKTLLTHKANAEEICAYLALARFTSKDNCYSTAGITAIANSCFMSRKLAEASLCSLIRYDLVMTELEFEERGLFRNSNNPPMPKKCKYRYVLLDPLDNINDDRCIWFDNSIMYDSKRSNSPLRSLFLFEYKDIAARVLLYLHMHYDDINRVCNYRESVHCNSETTDILSVNGVNIYIGNVSSSFVFSEYMCSNLYDKFIDIPREERKLIYDKLCRALIHLYRSGLIDYVIGVESDHSPGIPIYQLDVKHGDNTNIGSEERLCIKIEPALRSLGIRCAQGDLGSRLQFKKKYAGILPDTVNGKLIRYVRPRHIVSNPTNAPTFLSHPKKAANSELVNNLTSMLTQD